MGALFLNSFTAARIFKDFVLACSGRIGGGYLMRLGSFSIPFLAHPAAIAAPKDEPNSEPVLLVHGTFSNTSSPPDRPTPWWVPDSPFCRQLDASLAKLGAKARTWTEQDVFAWSGSNSESERRSAAEALSSRLRIIEQDPRIKRYHLIAHSHGGNVVLQALRKFQPQCLGAVIFMGTPYLEFRDTKPRVTPRRVALAVYWLGLGASAAAVWREQGLVTWSLLATFVVCLFLSWSRKPASKNKQPLGFPVMFDIPRSASYGSGVPFAFVFQADEALNLFRHVAKMAKEPRETFDTWFQPSKDARQLIRPIAPAPRSALWGEMNELPHARLLRTLWNKSPISTTLPTVGQAPGSWESGETAGLIWALLNSFPPIQIVAILILVIIYALVILPFLIFAVGRGCWRGVLRLLDSIFRKVLWKIGPGVTSQYLLRKTFGLNAGRFLRFQTLPPEIQKPQPISAELESRMSDLSRSAGGWAGTAFSGSLADAETSHIPTRFADLFDNPGLAHTQYYQEPEIVDGIASLIAKATAPGLETSFTSPGGLLTLSRQFLAATKSAPIGSVGPGGG